MNPKKKSTNPLYVVTNNGKDVEAALGFFDALIKKFHLAPFIEAFEAIFKELLEMISSYPLLLSVKQVFDEWIQKIEEMMALMGLAGPSKV